MQPVIGRELVSVRREELVVENVTVYDTPSAAPSPFAILPTVAVHVIRLSSVASVIDRSYEAREVRTCGFGRLKAGGMR